MAEVVILLDAQEAKHVLGGAPAANLCNIGLVYVDEILSLSLLTEEKAIGVGGDSDTSEAELDRLLPRTVHVVTVTLEDDVEGVYVGDHDGHLSKVGDDCCHAHANFANMGLAPKLSGEVGPAGGADARGHDLTLGEKRAGAGKVGCAAHGAGDGLDNLCAHDDGAQGCEATARAARRRGRGGVEGDEVDAGEGAVGDVEEAAEIDADHAVVEVDELEELEGGGGIEVDGEAAAEGLGVRHEGRAGEDVGLAEAEDEAEGEVVRGHARDGEQVLDVHAVRGGGGGGEGVVAGVARVGAEGDRVDEGRGEGARGERGGRRRAEEVRRYLQRGQVGLDGRERHGGWDAVGGRGGDDEVGECW